MSKIATYHITEGELYHYGVKGMRWGVRRYQNADGTLTKLGRQRHIQVTAREESATNGKHGRKVIDKYEKLKTSEQKAADKQAKETLKRLNQSRFDRNLGDDFDFLEEIDRPGSKLGKLYGEAVQADLVRAHAYVGAKWYDKYNRELVRAIDKDNRKFRSDIYRSYFGIGNKGR